MIHAHVYVESAPITENMIPCGGLEEVDEVLKTVAKCNCGSKKSFAINLKGHGSIVFMHHPDDFNQFKFIKRAVPEQQ